MNMHAILGPAFAAALTLSLSACSGSSADTSTDDASGTTSAPSTGAAPGGGTARAPRGGAFPGAIGEVAAVQGDVLQVQSATQGQVAVTLTGSTAITTQVPTSLDELAVGSCVVVTGAGDDSAGTAVTVQVSDPVDGECTSEARGGFPGAGGDERPPPSEAPRERPSDLPEGAGPGGAGGRGGVAVGEITALADAGFTVGDVTVTVDHDTTFTATEDGGADDISVGVCVSAQGEADDTGAVTAESLSISDKVDGECSAGRVGAGFGRRGGGRAGDDQTTQDVV